MNDFIPLEMFIIIISICALQMGRRRKESNRWMTILTAGLLLVGILTLFAYLYYSSPPSGFVVKIYPNTQLDFCIENGGLTFDQASGIGDSGTGFYIENLVINPGYRGLEFTESVAVIDLAGPSWAFGRVLKPYRDQVTLLVENGPPEVNLAFLNSSIEGRIQENAKITGVPPFETKIALKIAPNASLTYGPHYITIKGIGQDGKTSTCTCVLMVNKNCKNRVIVLE